MSWLAGIFAPLTQWLKNRGEIAQAKHVRDLTLINSQGKLAQSKVDNIHAWEMANLADKDKGLRYFSYTMFSAPIIITVVSPTHGAEIFKNLELVPPWLVKTFIVINGGVWGIASLKNIAPQFIQAIKKARQS